MDFQSSVKIHLGLRRVNLSPLPNNFGLKSFQYFDSSLPIWDRNPFLELFLKLPIKNGTVCRTAQLKNHLLNSAASPATQTSER